MHVHPKEPLVWSYKDWYDTDAVIETFTCNGTLRLDPDGRRRCVEYDTYLRQLKEKASL